MGFYRHDQRGVACLAEEHEVIPFGRDVVTVSEINFYREEAITEAMEVNRHSISEMHKQHGMR